MATDSKLASIKLQAFIDDFCKEHTAIPRASAQKVLRNFLDSLKSELEKCDSGLTVATYGTFRRQKNAAKEAEGKPKPERFVFTPMKKQDKE